MQCRGWRCYRTVVFAEYGLVPFVVCFDYISFDIRWKWNCSCSMQYISKRKLARLPRKLNNKTIALFAYIPGSQYKQAVIDPHLFFQYLSCFPFRSAAYQTKPLHGCGFSKRNLNRFQEGLEAKYFNDTTSRFLEKYPRFNDTGII